MVFRRGNPSLPGARVPRRFLTLLGGTAFTKGSGRLELAQAIASRDNPLTARVIVNRLWQHHFGQGLVATPGDFGMRAAPPTHPALLDWLASELIGSGWSLKHVHRLIVTSAAFRQRGETMRRRLSLEGLRDALLVAGGNLDARLGGPSVKGEMGTGTKRRTLYSHVDRIAVQGLFRTFDFPSPDASSPERSRTLVPQQMLFLMNSPFVLHAARGLAGRTASLKDAERVTMLYRIAFGARSLAGGSVAGRDVHARPGRGGLGAVRPGALAVQRVQLRRLKGAVPPPGCRRSGPGADGETPWNDEASAWRLGSRRRASELPWQAPRPPSGILGTIVLVGRSTEPI